MELNLVLHGPICRSGTRRSTHRALAFLSSLVLCPSIMSGMALTPRRNRAYQGGSLRHYLDMLVYPNISAKVLTTAAEMSRCRRRATFVGLRIGGYEWSDSQLRIIRVIDVCVRLLFLLLSLGFLVHIGAHFLNILPPAHRLGTP